MNDAANADVFLNAECKILVLPDCDAEQMMVSNVLVD